ncbi:MAG TPA: MbtH family NRPS accessory protein [Actinophytocola sp.]|jgi:MbtH protein|uniref:MbtH family NRPS accessory protein n=1 Tax=Actinophytocola sp. TaxID=1872138 RepID=UPI002E0B792C|nr:MbtH family NRPS accessory protein [Actinophytocola sp.]
MKSTEYSEFYRVVVNREGCYSLWPTEAALPSGWTPIGFAGPREAALNQVAELWRTAAGQHSRSGPDKSAGACGGGPETA